MQDAGLALATGAAGAVAGEVTTDFGGSNDVAFAMAIQAAGKIVAAGLGDAGSNPSDFALGPLPRFVGGRSLDERTV